MAKKKSQRKTIHRQHAYNVGVGIPKVQRDVFEVKRRVNKVALVEPRVRPSKPRKFPVAPVPTVEPEKTDRNTPRRSVKSQKQPLKEKRCKKRPTARKGGGHKRPFVPWCK